MSSGLPLNQSHTHNFLDLVLANEFAAGKRIRINNTDINSNPFKPATGTKRKQPKTADNYTSLNHIKNSNIKRHWQINSLSCQAILFASLPGGNAQNPRLLGAMAVNHLQPLLCPPE